MRNSNPQKLIWLTGLAIFSSLYGLVVLWYVLAQPLIPITCSLENSSQGQADQPGLIVQDAAQLDGLAIHGSTPAKGDLIIEAGGKPVQSFTDWLRVHKSCRTLEVGSEGVLQFGVDPTEDPNLGDLAVVEYPDRSRHIRIFFLRPGDTQASICFVPLVPADVFGVSITLVWYLLQLCVVIVGGIAFWNRRTDQPVRTFFALSSVTLLAFVGGSYWWVIASSPILVSVFAIAAALLPAVLLHFLTVFPTASPVYTARRGLCLMGIYCIPSAAAVALTGLIGLLWLLTVDFGQGPFAASLERIGSRSTRFLLPTLRQLIQFVLIVSVVYFMVCLQQLVRSYRVARTSIERSQVKWILFAAVFATLPIGYTVSLSVVSPIEFAFGAARIPMFLASLAFMLAYGIGIARFKLMLIDQFVSRGVWYYGCSIALALVFSAFIAVGAVNALHQDLSIFGQTVPLILVLMTSILVLSWLRDRVQSVLDRNFFSEKYQLDKALRRMNRVVSDVLEPEAVSASLLDSCCEVLHVDEAALYLQKKDTEEFRLLMASRQGAFPLSIHVSADANRALVEHRILQRVPQATSPAQSLIRELNAEVIHGLEIQDQLRGILVLGPKPNRVSFSAEDVAFVIALARITAIALHCARVQQDVVRLNQDLKIKIEKISDQERQLAALRYELAAMTKPIQTEATPDSFERGGIKGSSAAILEVLDTVKKVAASSSSVLIRGESGTGKELLARAIHENSPRRSGPLVSVHCAALSPTLLESELFGHVKGAFTDAREEKIGRFQLADGGTLFLDEIGDISLETQIKLLRVLQERTFEPVGSTRSVSVDVRIVAATHQDLEQLIAVGRFREDLFYRMNVISLTLPPLRERKDDLLELAVHFLHLASQKSGKRVFHLDDAALSILEAYSWPGNIRELQNVIERAVVMAEGDSVLVAHLPAELVNAATSPGRFARISQTASQRSELTSAIPRLEGTRPRQTPNLPDEEVAILKDALMRCDGNKTEAARMLGMPRSTFFSKLKKHGIA